YSRHRTRRRGSEPHPRNLATVCVASTRGHARRGDAHAIDRMAGGSPRCFGWARDSSPLRSRSRGSRWARAHSLEAEPQASFTVSILIASGSPRVEQSRLTLLRQIAPAPREHDEAALPFV